MLSTLPKLADRGFVLGFFLPALLFALALLWLFSGSPTVELLLERLAAKDLGSATFLLVGVWFLAVLMLMLNHPIYRLLEGYAWPLSKWDRAKERNQRRLKQADTKLRELFEKTRVRKPPDKIVWAYSDFRRDMVRALPTSDRDVLPTAFGNAIKAFEVYPRDVYGVDAVPVWLRLVTVLPKGFQDQIMDLRNQVDFLVNACVFAVGVAVAALAAALTRMPWTTFFGNASPWSALGVYPWAELSVAGLALFLSRGFYCWAVLRVSAWGDLVMTAFDCYLPTLAAQLGYTLPATSKRRRAFWTEFGRMIVYRQNPDGDLPFLAEDWPKAAPASAGGGDGVGRSPKGPKSTDEETEESNDEQKEE